MLNTMKVTARIAVVAAVSVTAAAQSPRPPITTPSGWRSTMRSAHNVEAGGRMAVQVDADAGEGVVWRDGSVLQDGAIEVDLRGRDVVGQSFVGVAFRGVDDKTFEVVYFRPFNFATTDADRKLRAVQYHSSPDNPWAKLRAEHPNQYEKPIAPVPDPNDWFHARVVVQGQTVNVFVNGSTVSTLTVTALAPSRPGMVGLWVGNGSGGEFANLRITPER